MDDTFVDLENRVGVPAGFFRGLLAESDWSFVIKLHAFIEAVCTQSLTYHFQEPALRELLARLELSNPTTGKLAFLKRLELMGSHSRRYVISLSGLRNDLVHNVARVSFSFEGYIATMDEKELKEFAISFSPMETMFRDFQKMILPGGKKLFPDDHSMHSQAKIDTIIARAKDTPKQHVWIGSHYVITTLLDMEGASDARNYDKAKATLYGSGDED